jgi:hypothetical protein
MPLKHVKANPVRDKYSRLPTLKKPLYYYSWKKKYGDSPIGFIGRVEHFPPIMKTKKSEFVIIDWKKRIVRNIWGKPIGKLPTRMKLDRYCPDTLEISD